MPNTIRLKRGTTEPTAQSLVTGELAVNTGDANIYTKLDDGTVSLVKGKASRLEVAVRNQTGSTIPAGSVVYISGAASNKPLISLSRAHTEVSSSKTLGLTTATILNNQNGFVVMFGTLDKIDTTAYTAGQALWLSATTAGGMTTTMPVAPNHAVFIGVVSSSASNGKIEVRVANGYELGELHDVLVSGQSNEDILSFESSTGLWKNKTASALGLAKLNSPAFTGSPSAPNGTATNSATSQIATQNYAYEMSTLYPATYSESGWDWSYVGNLSRGRFVTYESTTDATVQLPTDLTYNFNVGHRIVFGQVGTGKLKFASAGIALTSLDGKTDSSGPGAVVTAVKHGGNAWWIFGDLVVGFPAAGTVLSTACAPADGTDYNGNYYSGNWNVETTYANGSGGSYTSITGSNSNGCYLPSGWVYESFYSDATLSWTHGFDSGNFVYGSSYSVSQADGSGGQYNSSGTNISATENQVVHSYEGYDGANGWATNEILKFRTTGGMGPELYTESFPAAGVTLGSGCTTVTETDASGTQYTNIPKGYTTIADGNGGSNTSTFDDSSCGYYPSGYYVSYSSQCFQSLTYTDEYGGNQSFCYNSGYYYDAADGMGGTYSGSQSTYQAQSGDVFYSYYDGAGGYTINYHYDGSNSYYTSNSY